MPRIDWIPVFLPAAGAAFGVLVVSYLAGGGIPIALGLALVVFLTVALIAGLSTLFRHRA